MEDFVRRAIFASSVALLCLIMAPTAAAEQSTATGLRLDITSFTTDRLPPRGDASAILADLEYEDAQTPRLFQADINGDAAVDYIVEAAPSLCGNGGCPYAVVDGRTIEHLGTFFGSLLILLERRGPRDFHHLCLRQPGLPGGLVGRLVRRVAGGAAQEARHIPKTRAEEEKQVTSWPAAGGGRSSDIQAILVTHGLAVFERPPQHP
jgi:hypothetical protein